MNYFCLINFCGCKYFLTQIDRLCGSLLLSRVGVALRMFLCPFHTPFCAFSDNLLKTVPEEIGCLKNLSNLDLHSNQVALVWQVYLAWNIYELLCHLSISSKLFKSGWVALWLHAASFHLYVYCWFQCQLTEFPGKACTLRLSLLDLSNNNLSGLPSELGMLDPFSLSRPMSCSCILASHVRCLTDVID